MEQPQDQLIRLQICQKCYQHQSYDFHSQKQYQQAYEEFNHYASQIGLKILRNVPPKYLRKAPNSKLSTKRYIDTNNSKLKQFPLKGSFQVYYKNILIYSKQQTSTFPDLQYLCLILKILKHIYKTNPSLLSSLERFRDLQYEWKKNNTISQSLYHYIKLNACGNNTQRCIKDILQNLMSKYIQQNHDGKKKQVYPYSIYIGKQKKYKMQSIYCPKGGTSRLYVRPVSSTFANHKMLTKKTNQQGQMDQNSQDKLKGVHFWTHRSSGKIVRNINKTHLFEMVLKQQNKNMDEQKLKKWLKQTNLTLQKQQRRYNKSSRNHSPKTQNKTTKKQQTKNCLPIKNKVKKKNNSKQVFVSFLQNLKKNIKVQNPNNKNKLTPNKKTNHLNSNTAQQQDKCINKKSSIRSNMLKYQTNQIEYLKNKKGGLQGNDQKKQQQNKENNQKYQEGQEHQQINNKNNIQNQINKDQNIDHFPQTNYRYSICQQQFQQLQNSPNIQKSPINNYDYLNQQNQEDIKQDRQLDLQTERLLNSQIKKIYQQSLNSMFDKRVSIEQVTVKKRINQRKRSSFHERHAKNYNRYDTQSFEKQIQCSGMLLYQSKIKNMDIFEDMPVEQQWENNIIDYSKEWQKYKDSFIQPREPASIIRKFVSQNNFNQYNSYLDHYNSQIKQPNSAYIQFKITGEELVKKFIVKSIQTICKPTQIKLFPQIFKQIQFEQNSLITSQISNKRSFNIFNTQNKLICNNHYYKSKLVPVINLMLRSNPMTISRIFQDKKYINPYGVYCIWLRNLKGCYQPIFINDYFAFQELQENDGSASTVYKPIYSWLSHENSIWYMLLEKAVAKILGGYHVINELSLSQLMGVIMGAPSVDIGFLNPQKGLKIFDEKLFYNKMASAYALRQNPIQNIELSDTKSRHRVDRIVGFTYNSRSPKQSAIRIKVQQSTLILSLQEFILVYSQIALLFFSNNYYINQSPLAIQKNCKQVISCRLSCQYSKNNCYMIFSSFPEKQPTKVTLYRQLSGQQLQYKEGVNPLSEQCRRYEYIGQITKTGNFFIQLQITGGQYICLMQNTYEILPFISIYSQNPIQIGQIYHNQLIKKQKKPQIKEKTKSKQKDSQSRIRNSKVQQKSGNSFCEVPKILIQRKIHRYQQSRLQNCSKISKNLQKQKYLKNKIKIKKQYAYQFDNIEDKDETQQDNQQNKENNHNYLNQLQQKDQNKNQKKNYDVIFDNYQ